MLKISVKTTNKPQCTATVEGETVTFEILKSSTQTRSLNKMIENDELYVKIIDNKSEHNFSMGEILAVYGIQRGRKSLYVCSLDDEDDEDVVDFNEVILLRIME